MTRPAPYEPVTARRMWGVFPFGAATEPIAMFRDPDEANGYASACEADCAVLAVLAVDDVTGWAWNDIDPPVVES